ncbi:hypothetical protein D3C71_2037080 [compost metagenome]
MAAFKRLMRSAGVPLGAQTPYQDEYVISGKPLSRAVGTSGVRALRLAAVTAIGLTLPALVSGSMEIMESSNSEVWPPATSIKAGCVPR